MLEDKKNELQELREEQTKGSYIRSRVQWLRAGEKPTNFFCSLERRNYLEKTIKRIHKSNGDILTKQEDILSEVKGFYRELFKNNDNVLNELTVDSNSNSNSNSTFIALNLRQKTDSKAHHTKTLFNIQKPETLQGSAPRRKQKGDWKFRVGMLFQRGMTSTLT